MHIADGRVILSPTDLTAAIACEFAWLRQLDVSLGRAPSAGSAPDAMLQRTSELGAAHEALVLDRLVERFGEYDAASGRGVYQLPRPVPSTAAVASAARDTLRVLQTGADVIYQGVINRDEFLGYPDFLIRRENGTWAVHDAKLARHAKVSALLQLAAYADQLRAMDIAVAEDACLELGSGEQVAYPIVEVIPVYRERVARVREIAAEHRAASSMAAWGDARYLACGHCGTCAAEVANHRDVLLVANLRASQRRALRAAGIDTIDGLAANTSAVPGISERTLASITAQARLQVQQSPPGDEPHAPAAVLYDVFNPTALAVLPKPDPGDIFFDFEGDPLWTDADPSRSGLEYLFGVIETPINDDAPVFRPFWAHSRAEERQALIDFIAYVTERRAQHPQMHIYHYAPYEKTALLRLAGRHGVCEDEVDNLLREGVLIDLYAVVRNALRVSQPSYSIKKLEPLYMGEELRVGDVTTATDSIVEYARYCELLASGQRDAAEAKLAAIADYNEYDCVSTLRLRDWLLARAAECGVTPAKPDAPEADEGTGSDDDGRIDADQDLADELTRGLADVPREQRTPSQQARALLAGALGYHQREDKPFWWAHFDRLQHPIDEWADTGGVMVIDTIDVISDWSMTGRQKSPHRTLRLTGTVDGGKDLDTQIRLLYEPTDMPHGVTALPGYRGMTNGAVTKRTPGDAGTVEVDERGPTADTGGSALPVAVAPGNPVPTGALHAAIVEVAQTLVSGAEGPLAIRDLLERRPSQHLSRTDAPPDLGRSAAAPTPTPTPAELADAAFALDHSYLAIQGPPGSGKTYTGARIVQALVARGWKIGVVAQSHRVVENFLDAVAKAGVPREQIGKKLGAGASPGADRGWTVLADTAITPWCAAQSGRGYLLGGTAWDFVNLKRVDRGQLDLIVIDEAGQFSLANTIAVSVAGQRLLLLGDPQQLPQVSQGTHPEPCDRSALSWIMGDHQVLPQAYGVFLSRSWRMHPTVCAAVSRLSYDGQLESQTAVTESRALHGVSPGIHVIAVEHEGNETSSTEEAQEVARQVRRFLGLRWNASDELRDDGTPLGPRPLTAQDILVVAPYNAQVQAISRAVSDAGIDGVRIGTVDKFQGQEAPVVIVSMAASAPSEVPRGMGFLLNRNRINVAVSRAQWCSVIIRSPRLTDYLPASPEELVELGAFVGMCSPAGSWR